MFLQYKILAGLILIASLFTGFELHERSLVKKSIAQGRSEVQKEWDSANAKNALINAQKEAKDLKDKKEKYDAYENQQHDTQLANSQLTTVNDSLRNDIANYKRKLRLPKASTSAGPVVDKGEVGADLLGECAERYSSMAKEAGRLADKVNGLIEQASGK